VDALGGRFERGLNGFTCSRRAPTTRDATPSRGIASTSPCTGNAAAAMIDIPAEAHATPASDITRPLHPTGAGGGGAPGRSAHRNANRNGTRQIAHAAIQASRYSHHAPLSSLNCGAIPVGSRMTAARTAAVMFHR
jgi:hypothetical protein